MKVADWFLNKNYTMNEKYAMNVTDPTVERETEKAYFLKFNTDYGVISGWFPKSVCTAETVNPVTVELQHFNVGDTVKHSKFGKGTVTDIVELGNDSLITVKFSKKTAHLMQSVAKLETA